MTRVERTLAALEKKPDNFGGYDVRASEIIAILKRADHDIVQFGGDMFAVGFMRGQRCERATQKRKKVKA